MNHSESSYEDLKFVNGKTPKTLSKEGIIILSKFFELTNFHNINTRYSLNEFLTRIFISFDLPLNHFIDNYFKTGVIFQVESNQGKLIIDVNLLQELIGLTNGLNFKFNYVGTTKEFLCQNGMSHWPKNFSPKVKRSLKELDLQVLKHAHTLAQFFTDKIEERFFEKLPLRKKQFCRTEISFECMEIKSAVIYRPLKTLPLKTLLFIRESIGDKKLDTSTSFLEDTTIDERLEEVIIIAYGIKNGFIDWNGSMVDYLQYVDPYYFISFTAIMDVYLDAITFVDLYHFWNMYEWIDLLPYHT